MWFDIDHDQAQPRKNHNKDHRSAGEVIHHNVHYYVGTIQNSITIYHTVVFVSSGPTYIVQIHTTVEGKTKKWTKEKYYIRFFKLYGYFSEKYNNRTALS